MNQTTSQPVWVPVLPTIHQYLFREYKDQMYLYLNQLQESGELASLVPFPFVPRKIYRRNCTFPHVLFRRESASAFRAEVETELLLDTAAGPQSRTFLLEMLLQTDDCEIRCEKMVLRPWDAPRKEGLLLDKYLIPCLTHEALENCAMNILETYLPESIRYPGKRSAHMLAKRMGLTVLSRPMWQHPSTESILFTDEGSLAVEMPDGMHLEYIPAGTIVLNCAGGMEPDSTFQIFHECFHYEYHLLFCRLQQICCNDPELWEGVPAVMEEGSPFRNPLYRLEWQANRGAMALLMPEEEMKGRIQTELSFLPYGKNPGERYQKAGLVLKYMYRQPAFRIRARMIQLGCVDAQGALHYADHRLLEPFAADRGEWKPRDTWVIRKAEVEKLKKEDSLFAELLASGEYRHVDGHLVRNDPCFLRSSADGLRLSDWALAHINRCCMRFRRDYTQKTPGSFEPGRIHYDSAYMNASLVFVGDLMKNQSMPFYEARKHYLLSLPPTLKGCVNKILKTAGKSQEALAQEMHLGVKALMDRLENAEQKTTLDLLIGIALILRMPDWLLPPLMERACLQFNPRDNRHLALQEILRVRWDDGLEAANRFLKAENMQPLHF